MTPTAVTGLRTRFRSPGTRTRPYLLVMTYGGCDVVVAALAPRVKGEPRTDVILLSHYDVLEPFPFADDSIHLTFPFLTQKNSR